MKRILFIFLIGLLSVVNLRAVVKISVPELSASSGQEIEIPIIVEGDDEFTAIQFDVYVDDLITLNTETYTSTERKKDHTFFLNKKWMDYYRCVYYSPTNSLFRGKTGTLLKLKAKVSPSCSQGNEYSVSLKNVIASRPDASECQVETQSGKIVISQSPDLAVSNVSFDKSSINPGEELICRWDVSNLGNLDSRNGFREQVYITDPSMETKILIGNSSSNSALKIGSTLSRWLSVKIPDYIGMEGKCQVMVKIIPFSDSGESESMASNNTAISGKTLNLGRKLYLSASSSTLDEKGNSTINFTVGRSNCKSQPQKVDISLPLPDSRVTIPESVTIPAGEWSVNGVLKVKSNGKADATNHILLNASADGYNPVEIPLTIIDDTPGMLKAELNSYEFKEGKTYDCTVTLPHALEYDAEIAVTSDRPKKIQLPDIIVIPVGETSKQFSILAIDNTEAELETSATIRIACENMASVEMDVSLIDDDMPTLELSFSPDVISESNGQLGVIATLTRHDNVDKEARIGLSHNGGDRLNLSSTVIRMPKGMKSAEFMIRTVDNDEVDGDHTFTITAAVYSSPCNCYANELSGGYINKDITITDDDGPHLTLKPSTLTFREGNDGYKLIVHRNTEPTEPLQVTLTSDKAGVVEFPASIEIPKGEKEIAVDVKVPKNDIPDDSTIVSFKAEANGLSAGSCRVSITDSTLPDAIISMEIVGQDDKDKEYLTNENIDLILTVDNQGVASLPAETIVKVKVNGKTVKTIAIPDAILPGETARIEAKEIRLPSSIGAAKIIASVNPENIVKELNYSNNESPVRILDILPAFHASVSTDRLIYDQKDQVVITGSTDSDAGKNSKVEIRIINGNNVFKAEADADENGHFTCTYNLLKHDLGHFSVSAGYPGDKSAQITSTFDVNGLIVDKSQQICELGVGENRDVEIKLSNLGTINYTNLKVNIPETSDAVKITSSTPEGIKAGSSGTIRLRVAGKTASEGKEFEQIPISITTAEGLIIPFKIYSYVYRTHGTLAVNIDGIRTNLALGSSVDYPIDIRNIGRGETGLITFSLPNWVETITPKEIPSLKQGETSRVILRFNSTEDMELNLKRTGNLAINCSKGDGLLIPFDITPVSDELSSLRVDVVDELSFLTEEKPHLAWASVSLHHPATGEIIDKGLSGIDGIFTTNQPAGHYLLKVTAQDHTGYSGEVYLSPGEILDHEVFLPYEAVTYEWNVVETEVEDEYLFETTAKFKTKVPKPMLEISFSKDRPELYDIIPVSVTNKGLVGMDDIHMSMAMSDGYRFEWQDDPTAKEIKGGETLVFYGRVVPIVEEEAPGRILGTLQKCMRMHANSSGKYKCDRHTETLYYSKDISYGNCISIPNLNFPNSTGGNIYGDYAENGSALQPSYLGGSSGDLKYSESQAAIPNAKPSNFCDKLNPDNFGNSGEHKEDPFSDDYFNPNDPSNEWVEKDVDGQPQKQDCDKTPVLKYKLVPASGRQYALKGLTADGSSQIRIALDTKNSLIPDTDGCYQMIECSWELSKDAGTIEGSDFMEAIYTAPDDFDNTLADRGDYVIRTEATFHCKLKGDNGLVEYTSEPVEIKIFRPAILMVHGLGDSQECWKTLNEDLLSEGYLPEFIYRVDYKRTNTSTLVRNVNVIPDGINTLRLRGLEKGIYIGKVDIVAHSTGGLLTRIYAQHSKENADRINRIITVNTPHAGSEIANTVLAHPIFGGSFAMVWYSLANGQFNPDLGIYKDIAVDSDAILSLNYAGSHPDIPVYATGTETFDPVATFAANVIVSYGGIALKNALKASSIFSGPIGFIAGLGVEYIAHYVDDLLQSWPGDFIVGSSSQTGGCESSSLVPLGMMHPWSSNDFRLLFDIKIN